jgi:hypothetical protein
MGADAAPGRVLARERFSVPLGHATRCRPLRRPNLTDTMAGPSSPLVCWLPPWSWSAAPPRRSEKGCSRAHVAHPPPDPPGQRSDGGVEWACLQCGRYLIRYPDGELVLAAGARPRPRPWPEYPDEPLEGPTISEFDQQFLRSHAMARSAYHRPEPKHQQ